MSGSIHPLVSFIVPTLNRGKYVVRAVQSCLDADAKGAGVDVEVVVLDSESDDGSWEALNERYGHDPRVTLAQNRRGLGPTKSWLDGAELARGDFLTFIWSDDFISPRFLTALVPALRGGAALSVGRGLIRDIDDESPLPVVAGEEEVERDRFLTGYFRRGYDDGVFRPVSPACSLFSREAFDSWRNVATAWCRETPLREELHWRRAIGPDLLLFLIAIRMTPAGVPLSREVVAQFSHHEDSFSVAASRLAYETGYWLARQWYLSVALPEQASKTTAASIAHAGAGICFGIILALHATTQFSSKGLKDARGIARETLELWRITWRRGIACKVALRIPSEFCRLFSWLLRQVRPSSIAAR